MAKLACCNYYNMVAILEKTEHNTDFHQIVDFLEASHIRYALTIRPTVYVLHIRQFWSTLKVETTDGKTKILAQINGRQRIVSKSSIRRHLKLNDKEVPQGKSSEHPSEPHHTPSDQDELIHHKPITQSLQHAQITSHEPIYQSHEQTNSQEPTITSQSHSVITTPRRITRGSIRISQSKFPSPRADETAFLTENGRYGEVFPTDTSLDAGQDRENIAKTYAMPHEALPRDTSLGGGEGKGCSKHEGMDQGKDLLDRHKSANKGSDSTDEMSHVLGSLGAENILASGGLRSVFNTTSLSVVTASTGISHAVATASGSFPTAAIFTTASVATPTTRVTRSSRGVPSAEKVLEQLRVQLARDLEAKFAQEDLIIREQAKRDSEIARIHAEKELEMMIAELNRSNEMVAKYLSKYEQAEVGLSHDEKEQQSEEPIELSKEELKKMIELVPVEELYIKALHVKYPIIYWEIYSKGQRKCWKNIRVGNHTKVYQIFKDVLKKFDREDLDKLWSLVKETCSTTEVTDEKAKDLWVELKRLYEPDSRDLLWAL
nr:hypothetical protein [Tanacetum cinerariifolium]